MSRFTHHLRHESQSNKVNTEYRLVQLSASGGSATKLEISVTIKRANIVWIEWYAS